MTDTVPFVQEAGLRYQPAHADPFQAWVELMEVVEAICTRWPERPPTVGDYFRL